MSIFQFLLIDFVIFNFYLNGIVNLYNWRSVHGNPIRTE